LLDVVVQCHAFIPLHEFPLVSFIAYIFFHAIRFLRSCRENARSLIQTTI